VDAHRLRRARTIALDADDDLVVGIDVSGRAAKDGQAD
jgi:hypothetical protein